MNLHRLPVFWLTAGYSSAFSRAGARNGMLEFRNRLQRRDRAGIPPASVVAGGAATVGDAKITLAPGRGGWQAGENDRPPDGGANAILTINPFRGRVGAIMLEAEKWERKARGRE